MRTIRHAWFGPRALTRGRSTSKRGRTWRSHAALAVHSNLRRSRPARSTARRRSPRVIPDGRPVGGALRGEQLGSEEQAGPARAVEVGRVEADGRPPVLEARQELSRAQARGTWCPFIALP